MLRLVVAGKTNPYFPRTPLGAVIVKVDEPARNTLEAGVADGWRPFVADGALMLHLPGLVATGQR